MQDTLARGEMPANEMIDGGLQGDVVDAVDAPGRHVRLQPAREFGGLRNEQRADQADAKE